jgi:sterol desaturase/sphingolipid hydroxylase (fatty acid hydroxylase superfamily)
MNAHIVLTTVAIDFAALIVVFLINARLDFGLHKNVLHGPPGTPPADWHRDHHHNHAGRSYNSAHEGETFGLKPSVFWLCVAKVSVPAGLISYLSGYNSIFVATLLSSIAFWWGLEVIHRRSHNPKPNGWLEKTRFFKWLDRSHRIHHAQENQMFTIMFPWMDLFFGTHPSQVRTTAREGDAHEA